MFLCRCVRWMGNKKISRQNSTAAYWNSVMNSADLLYIYIEHFDDVGRRVVTETMCERHVEKKNTEITCDPPSNKQQTYRQCGLDRRLYFMISGIFKAQSGLFVFLSLIFIACQLHRSRAVDVNVSVKILQGGASASLVIRNHVSPTT